MAEQNSERFYDNPYKFNAKELDTETGYYYYGARYYNPRTSIWLNVDPLVEKTMQPYSYTNNNPIRFIDSDGRAPMDIIYLNKDGSVRKVVDDGLSTVKIRMYGRNNLFSNLRLDIKRGMQIAANIFGYYRRKKGYGGKAGVKHFKKGSNTLAETNSDGIAYGAKGHLNEPSVREYKFLSHANVYLEQSQLSDNENAPNFTRASTAIGYATRLWNAYAEDEISWRDFNNRIDEFNKIHKGKINIYTDGTYYHQDGMNATVTVGKTKYKSVPLKRLKNATD